MATERNKMTAQEFEDGLFDLDGASEFSNILIYGDPGSQKTRFSGTCPGYNLYLAAEPGYISAARNGGQGKVRMITDSASGNAAASWLEDGNASKFNWLIFDGGATFQTKLILAYAAEAYDLSGGTKRAHRNLPDKPDYLNAQNYMKGFIARLIDLPVNVLMTTHAMRTETDDGDLWVKPQFQGKGSEVSDYIAGQFHVVGFIRPAVAKVADPDEEGKTKNKQVSRILWRARKDPKTDTTYFAKDQFGTLGAFSDDTTMPQVISRIAGDPEVEGNTPPPVKANVKKKAKARS